jgi:hypothetical protein
MFADAALAQITNMLPLSTLASLVLPDNITIVVPGEHIGNWKLLYTCGNKRIVSC